MRDSFFLADGSSNHRVAVMEARLSPFSRWALDGARTADERYLIFLMCEACRLLERLRQPVEVQRQTSYRSPRHEFWKELYLNPLLMPEFGTADTERAAAMAPYLTKFEQGSGYERRRIGDAGAVLRFFPALEVLELGGCDMKDISFVEALPRLRRLQITSGELEDLGPLEKCASLRNLSLQFVGASHPCMTPPIYWLDARPLGALRELENLAISPNAAVLSGLTFPSLKSAQFGGGNCVQRDCSYLPDMPELRLLKLEGPQSLRGIGRFPGLRHLQLSGPLRDFGDIAELKHLSCLEVQTLHGWPTDVTPLTALPELLWVRFTGEIPRNYWPLAQAPRLCELSANDVPSIKLEVQAVNAVLRPWDEVFLLPELRPRPPLRFVVVQVGGDTSVLPKSLPEPGPEYLAHPKLFHLELLWMHRRAQEVLEKFGGQIEQERSSVLAPTEIHWERSVGVEIQTIAAAQRLPELLEALREVMAGSPHPWRFQICLNLRITKLEMTEQQKKWIAQIEKESRSWDDERDSERWQMTKQHLIDTQFRLRTSKEEGETPDPEDFEPPDEIRPESSRRAASVPSGPKSGEDDSEEKERPDFGLKPFDEQEQNSGDSDDGDDNQVITAPPPEPPPGFWDDPYAHPLADSYRFYATLTFDAFYQHGHNVATVVQLMGREPDEFHAAPERGK